MVEFSAIAMPYCCSLIATLVIYNFCWRACPVGILCCLSEQPAQMSSFLRPSDSPHTRAVAAGQESSLHSRAFSSGWSWAVFIALPIIPPSQSTLRDGTENVMMRMGFKLQAFVGYKGCYWKKTFSTTFLCPIFYGTVKNVALFCYICVCVQSQNDKNCATVHLLEGTICDILNSIQLQSSHEFCYIKNMVITSQVMKLKMNNCNKSTTFCIKC